VEVGPETSNVKREIDLTEAQRLAAEIVAELRALPVYDTPSERAVRRKYSHRLKRAQPELILALARELLTKYDERWMAYELLHNHKAAWQSLGEAELEEFGRGINSWWTVDAFARTLAGPAWLRGQVADALIHRWAHSPDLWWRRAALVSTVALNVRSQGGYGDVPRTLAVCRLLVADREDMVVKALSWALRELVAHDPEAVRAFLQEHEAVLAARVKHEVRNKLTTGRKYPRWGAMIRMNVFAL
jgi:3-methyladenine DNA glycosylase AlkD